MRAQLLRFGLLMAFAGAWLGACASGSKSDQSGGHGGSGQGAGGSGGAGGFDVCASASNGTPCGDPNEPACDLSACAGGVCVPATAPLDTLCGSPVDTECDPADGCDGAGPDVERGAMT